MTIDDAIQHCHEVAESLRNSDPCDACAAEHEQLAQWLEELVQLRVALSDSAKIMKVLRAERDAAVSDLHKFVPAWRWDGAVSPKEDIPKNERVEFG